MKILWCTHSLAGFKPEVGGYNGCGWITALLNEIKKVSNIEIGIAFYYPKKEVKIESDNIIYYPICSEHINVIDKVQTFFGNYSGWVKTEILHINKLLYIIDDFKPDLIHVWGTETDMGLIAKKTKIPVIIHLQGLLHPYNNALCPPGFSRLTYVFKDGCNLKQILKNVNSLRYWEYKSEREIRILQSCRYYFGRTHWDKAMSSFFSPQSVYYYCSEMLRSDFYLNDNIMEFSDSKLRIVSTISPPLYKGADMILKTAKLLKDFGDINFEWDIIGVDNIKIFEKKTGISSKNVNVNCLGVKSVSEIRKIELKSHLYFHPSYIDNSPNSVCEAQILGLPVIAVNVGGLSSIVEDNKTGILIPSNEPHMAAYKILCLANDKEKSNELSKNGSYVAAERHKKENIIGTIISTYKAIIEQ